MPLILLVERNTVIALKLFFQSGKNLSGFKCDVFQGFWAKLLSWIGFSQSCSELNDKFSEMVGEKIRYFQS